MNRSVIVATAALVLGHLAVAGVAHARNPHCAGGIQYWQQWYTDKQKGNLDDYHRELMKSIQQLEMCSAEDPKDFEALGYLGWCYAEADSAAAAGRAFTQAIDGLNAKGDKKGAERVVNNRDSYWSIAFNAGIKKISSAQTAYPDFLKKPEAPKDDSLKAEAARSFDQALVSLKSAASLKPEDPRTLRNLGTVYALRGDYAQAESLLRAGLKVAPADTDLVNSMRSVRINLANQMIEEKKYDEAITAYEAMIQADPNNPNLRLGSADAYFKRAQTRDGDARKPDFKSAGDAYAKAGELNPGNGELPFNAALAYQSAGELALAEGQWRATLKIRPDDVEALSALGATLADLKKLDEAIRELHHAITLDPKNKSLHRQLGAVYTKAGNNPKGTEELMVYLALQNGQPAADPAAEVKKFAAGSQAGKTLASAGAPEQVYPWTADNDKYQTWFYWSKKIAYHFKDGTLVQKSDWSVPDLKIAPGGGSK